MSLPSLLAWPLGSGVTGSAVIGAAGGTFAYLRAQAEARKRQRETLARAGQQHLEVLAQQTAHHNARLHQAEKHHQQQLDQAQAHHEALRDHLTATLRLPAKQPRPAKVTVPKEGT